MQEAKQTAQTLSPAQLGRKQRIQDFRQFIEANRKDKTVRQIMSEYCIDTGLSRRVVESYFRLFTDSGIYVKPCYATEWKIVTSGEYRKLETTYDMQRAT